MGRFLFFLKKASFEAFAKTASKEQIRGPLPQVSSTSVVKQMLFCETQTLAKALQEGQSLGQVWK